MTIETETKAMIEDTDLKMTDRTSRDGRGLTTAFDLMDTEQDGQVVRFEIHTAHYTSTKSIDSFAQSAVFEQGAPGEFSSTKLAMFGLTPSPMQRTSTPLARFSKSKLAEAHNAAVAHALHPAMLPELIAWAIENREENAA